MGKPGKGVAKRNADSVGAPTSKSLPLAERGIQSSGDFRNLMSALMTDVIRGALNPEITNAACNAGGKLLKMVELEYKYAVEPDRRNRQLNVANELAPVAIAS